VVYTQTLLVPDKHVLYPEQSLYLLIQSVLFPFYQDKQLISINNMKEIGTSQ